jgi:hypothetical protein
MSEMKNVLNAGRTLAVCAALSAASALAYAHCASVAAKSPDPYDNLADIGVGANAGVMLFVAACAGGLAALLLLVAAAGRRFESRRRRVSSDDAITRLHE